MSSPCYIALTTDNRPPTAFGSASLSHPCQKQNKIRDGMVELSRKKISTHRMLFPIKFASHSAFRKLRFRSRSNASCWYPTSEVYRVKSRSTAIKTQILAEMCVHIYRFYFDLLFIAYRLLSARNQIFDGLAKQILF